MNFSKFIDGSLWLSMPNWIIALLLLTLGWCVAILVRIAIAKMLEFARFNKACEKTGFAEFLRKGQVSYSPSRLVGVMVYWIILLAVLFHTSTLLNIEIAETLSRRLAMAAPGFVAAVLIAVVGIIIVSFMGNFVLTVARNAASPHARLFSQIVKCIGIILVVGIALEQVNIGTAMITSIFLMFFGAVVFGLALSFGLGCKDMARDAMEKMLKHLGERNQLGKDADLEG